MKTCTTCANFRRDPRAHQERGIEGYCHALACLTKGEPKPIYDTEGRNCEGIAYERVQSDTDVSLLRTSDGVLHEANKRLYGEDS